MSGTSKSRNRWLAPGKASDYIRHIDSLRPGAKVVLWCRVSIGANEAHLAHQEAALREAADDRSLVVAAVVRHVGPGYDNEYRDAPCWWLAVARAGDVARQHGASLLATETDRLIRDAACYMSPRSRPRAHDYRMLANTVEDVALVTLADPDAPPSEARSRQTKRGQAATGRKGGRPRRTEQKELLEVVWKRYRRLRR